MTQSAGRYPTYVDPALLFLRHRDPLAVAGATYYHGVVIALDSQGRAAKATGAAGLKIVGWYDGETFTAAATDRVSVSNGVIPMVNSSTDPVTIADLKNVVYLESDDTIARTSAGGTLSPCGILELYEDSTPKVQIGGLPPSIVAPSTGSLLLHAPVANAAAMTAIPANERANGMQCLDLGQDIAWVFDSGSAVAADDWTREPDAGSGRWLRKHITLADLTTLVIPAMQSFDVTLSSGSATKNTGIVVASTSEVIPFLIGALSGTTNLAAVGELKASRVNGAAGVGTVVIQAYGDDGAIDADAAGTVRVVILTPQ